MTLEEIRQKANKSLYFFCKNILGYTKMSTVPHQELCDFFTAGKKKKNLGLMPRGSFKSSVITVGKNIKTITKNPNIRILITSQTQKNAKKYFKEIKTHFESNKRLRALYGDFRKGSIAWREDEIIVNKRTIVRKEPTIMYSSLEKQTLTGMHFDHIILDDVVDINNSSSPEQVQKTIDYYRYLLSVLEPDGTLDVVGTRYRFYDLYGWILDTENGEREQFGLLKKEAWDKNGVLIMPKVLTKEFLGRQRKTQGEFIFNCQYMNNPTAVDVSIFRSNQIKYFEKAPLNVNYFMTVDPAVSTKGHSDFTGIIVNAVDDEHNWYIEEALALKVDPSGLVAEIMRLAKQYQPMMALGMEEFMLEKFLKVNLVQEMEKQQFFFPIQSVPTNNRVSKEARIKALHPKFEAGQVYVRKDQYHLIDQIIYFPQTKNDDVLDALKSQLQITFPADPLPDKPEKGLEGLSRVDQKAWLHVRKMGNRTVRKKKWISI